MTLLKTMSGELVSAPRHGFVRSLSRKRILIRSVSAVDGSSFPAGLHFESVSEPVGPPNSKKRRCEEEERVCTDLSVSVLQSLPQDLLIKIICGVNHDDLKQLVQVSKPISEASKVAKEMYFAFATPSKVPAFRNPISPGESSSSSGEDDEKAPNAPHRIGRRRLSDKKREELAEVSVSLFGSDSEVSEEERWPRRKLFKD